MAHSAHRDPILGTYPLGVVIQLSLCTLYSACVRFEMARNFLWLAAASFGSALFSFLLNGTAADTPKLSIGEATKSTSNLRHWH